MNFFLGEAERIIDSTARSFARDRLEPFAERFEREHRVPRGVFQELADLGFFGFGIPSEYGGSEAGALALSLAMEQVARASASVAVTLGVTNMVGEVIVRFGTEAQKRTFLPGLAGGQLGAFALSEAEAGSDPASMTTRARRDGDDWVLDGAKQWITHGDIADVWLIWAKTSPNDLGDTSCFVVPRGSPGLVVGEPEDKLGLRASSTVPLSFDALRVPSNAVLGEVGQGLRVAFGALDGGRINIASQACGIGEAALAEAVRYCGERRAFGKSIASFQAIQWKIANSRMGLEAARLLALRAAWKKDRGLPYRVCASMAKRYATDAAWRVCNDAVQVLGGYGYTREFPVERYLRDVRVGRIYEGTNEIQRLVIARSILAGTEHGPYLLRR